jgi:hypothetical protein
MSNETSVERARPSPNIRQARATRSVQSDIPAEGMDVLAVGRRAWLGTKNPPVRRGHGKQKARVYELPIPANHDIKGLCS